MLHGHILVWPLPRFVEAGRRGLSAFAGIFGNLSGAALFTISLRPGTDSFGFKLIRKRDRPSLYFDVTGHKCKLATFLAFIACSTSDILHPFSALVQRTSHSERLFKPRNVAGVDHPSGSHLHHSTGSFAVSQFFMSAAMRSCPAFLMASDRFNPGGNFLACARASAARAAQS